MEGGLELKVSARHVAFSPQGGGWGLGGRKQGSGPEEPLSEQELRSLSQAAGREGQPRPPRPVSMTASTGPPDRSLYVAPTSSTTTSHR